MAAFPDHLVLSGNNIVEDLVVGIRVNRRAKHIYLKIEPGGMPMLVLPAQRHLRDARTFLQEKEVWLRAKLSQQPAAVPFEDGEILPLFGEALEIVHRPEARRGVWQEEDCICVSGDAPYLARRLTDWIKKQTKEKVQDEARRCVEILDCQHGRITLRDPKTRWGSCSASGDLSFSWRLAFAPPQVLRYVVAHECAHLREHNHSHRFWKLVRQLDPNFRASEKWLKNKGAQLHRYGMSA